MYATFGEMPAWIVGWNMNLRFGVSSGALIRGWTSYVVGMLKLLGITVPLGLYALDIFGYVRL